MDEKYQGRREALGSTKKKEKNLREMLGKRKHSKKQLVLDFLKKLGQNKSDGQQSPTICIQFFSNHINLTTRMQVLELGPQERNHLGDLDLGGRCTAWADNKVKA